LILVKFAIGEASKANDQNNVLAKAMEKLAKEQRATRQKSKGKDASSSDGEDGCFDCYKSLNKYGLGAIPSTHMQRTKLMEEAAKKAKNAAEKKKKDFLVPGSALEYNPQWMGPKGPKSFSWQEMSHAHWVAAWWSRAFCQLAAQGHAEVEAISFASMLTQFLNANKIAIEGNPKTAWEYDHQVWRDTSEKASRKDPELNVKQAFTVTNENKLIEVKSQVASKGQGKIWKGMPRDSAASSSGGQDGGAKTSKGYNGKGKKGKGKKGFKDSVFPAPKSKEDRR